MSHININAQLQRKNFTLDIDFALPDMGVSVILGPSGSGKSSLLRLIAGLEKPDTGFISVSNSIWVDSQAGICRPPQQRRVGMVFQDYALFHHLTVADNIAYVADGDNGVESALRVHGPADQGAVPHVDSSAHLRDRR